MALAWFNLFMFSAPVYGWGSLEQYMIAEGFFSKGCNDPTSGNCEEQKQSLNLYFTVYTTVTACAGLILGPFLDKMGAMWLTFVNGSFLLASWVILALCESSSSLLYLAAGLQGAGSVGSLFSSFASVFMFSEKYHELLFTSINNIFNASCAIPMIIWALYQEFPAISRLEMFLAYGVAAGACYYVWCIAFGIANRQEKRDDMPGALPVAPPPPPRWTKLQVESDSPQQEDRSGLANLEQELANLEQEEDRRSTKRLGVAVLSGLPFYSQLQSYQFVYLTIFIIISCFRANWLFAVLPDVLSQHGDSGAYTQYFNMAMPFGFVWIPIIAWLMRRTGLVVTGHIVNLIGSTCILLMLINNLYAQIPAILLFTLYRGFLYAYISFYAASVFGKETMGTMQGVCYAIGGGVNLLISPLYDFVNSFSSVENSYFWANVGLVLAGLILVVITEVLQCKSRRQIEADNSGLGSWADTYSLLK